MKQLTTILFLLMVLSVNGQRNINQTNEFGQKTGKWVTYHKDGRIDEVHFYRPSIKKLSKEEAFFRALPPDKDSTILNEELLWIEHYEYHTNEVLKRIKRIEDSKKTMYFYGSNREITVEPLFDYDFIGKVNDSETVSIELTNNSQQTITLHPISDAKNLAVLKEFVLLPEQASIFTFKYTFEPHHNYGKLVLKNDSLEIEFSVRGFGYHLETKDIEEGKPLTIPHRFVYFRTGDETLIRLYDKNQKEVLKTIPIHNPKSDIDLSKFGEGTYWICSVDYSADLNICCEIRIEK